MAKINKKKPISSSKAQERLKARRASLNKAKLVEIEATPQFLSDPYNDPLFRPLPLTTSNEITIRVGSMFLISLGYIIFSLFMFVAGGVLTHWLIHHPEHNPFPALTKTNAQLVEKINQSGYLPFNEQPAMVSDEIFPPTETSNYIIEYASNPDQQAAEKMAKQLKIFNIETNVLQRENASGYSEYVLQSKSFPSYDEAYQALAKAPEPYRSWGRIDRLNKRP